MIMARGGDEPSEPSTNEPVEVAAPEPEPEPEPPPLPAKVTIELTTNVDAEIVDASTNAILGRTNGAGLSLDRSETPREVLLRAPGHTDLPVSLPLTEDLRTNYALEAAPVETKKKAGKKKKKKKKGGDPFSLLPVDK